MSKIKPYILVPSIVAGILIVDLVVKALLDDKSFVIIPKVLSVYSVYNYGIAWSWLSNGGTWLVVFTGLLIVAAAFAWVYCKRQNAKKKQGHSELLCDLAFGLFIGGALGNFIDRLFLGYVRDFIRFDFMSFPVFNIADICLNAAVVLLIVWQIYAAVWEKKNGNKSN